MNSLYIPAKSDLRCPEVEDCKVGPANDVKVQPNSAAFGPFAAARSYRQTETPLPGQRCRLSVSVAATADLLLHIQQ